MILKKGDPRYADLPGLSVLLWGMWIANRSYSAGEHVVAWSPSETDLTPGVYFIRLACLGTVSSQRLVVLR